MGTRLGIEGSQAQPSSGQAFSPVIPKTWDDAAMATLEVPLANPIGSPKHVPASYYYKIPVLPIYKSYTVYAPGHEPPGYMDWLKQQEPPIVWGVDPKTGVEHTPPLETKADWIRAGELVFDSPISFTGDLPDTIRAALYRAAGRPVAAHGVNPFSLIVIRQKGRIEVGVGACAECHTRVMGDGTVVKGPQGNNPIDRAIAFALLHGELGFGIKDRQALTAFIRLAERASFEVPWLNPADQFDYNQMSLDEIAAAHAAIPGGVFARQRTSILSPPHIPDLIGVRDRHYLDATGLQQHRGIADLMRYSALNQGGDNLASYDGFIPAAGPQFKRLPGPIS
jgi:hypothetical protein